MRSDDGNIVNLSQFKAKKRKEKKASDARTKAAQAAANRARTGRTGAAKKADRLQQERSRSSLDGHHRDTAASPISPSSSPASDSE